jgi:hypothetical protein
VNIKAQKAALDSSVLSLSKRFDTHLGIIDFMTKIASDTGSIREVLSAMAGGKALTGTFAPFNLNRNLTLAAIEEFFQALGDTLRDPPSKTWGSTPVERIQSAFAHYTQCAATTRSVLNRLTGAADQALAVLGNDTATGRLGDVSYKRGKLRSADARNFPLPSTDAIMIFNSQEHIFVLAQVDKSWRIYQSFQNRFMITQPGTGCAPVHDMRKFLTDITGSGAQDWFGAETVVSAFQYVVLT